MHDVVEVHQEVAVGQHVLVSGHHLADELVSLQLASLVLNRQHGGLGTTEDDEDVLKGYMHKSPIDTTH